MAKAMASDAADLAARVALQVHGAIGYTWECDLHFFMKRTWALSGLGRRVDPPPARAGVHPGSLNPSVNMARSASHCAVANPQVDHHSGGSPGLSSRLETIIGASRYSAAVTASAPSDESPECSKSDSSILQARLRIGTMVISAGSFYQRGNESGTLNHIQLTR